MVGQDHPAVLIGSVLCSAFRSAESFVELTPAIPADVTVIPLDHVIAAAFRTSFFHLSSPPSISAFRAFPITDNILID